MKSDRLRAYCPRCQHVQVFRRTSPTHRWHLLLTVLTAGVWLVSWVSAIVFMRLQPWRCRRCDWNLPRAIALSARQARRSGAKPRSSSASTAP